ncbi:MAG: DUF4391 domain-containing protein [Fibrobacteres bacterium]|nr:DUF4391 domain-containing protein [Fibrobacterota bacterium]
MPKKTLYAHTQATDELKALFVEQVERIVWEYELSSEGLHLPEHPTAPMIQAFALELRVPDFDMRLVQSLDKRSRFPVFYELRFESRVKMVAAFKEPGARDADLWKCGPSFQTAWLARDTPRAPLPLALDMGGLYTQMLRLLMPLPPLTGETLAAQVQRLEEIRDLQAQVRKLLASRDREKQFNRNVELNAVIAALAGPDPISDTSSRMMPFMDKLKMHTPNLTATNVERIRELFPNCVAEAQDEKGALRLSVDFDQLRQELSDSIVDGPQERYQLNWPGKREALITANAPIAKTLRPCREESVNFDTTQNLFIEGDNLDALKLLQETYLGKVKMIYIDPPYNTGNDFIYEDDFADDAQSFLEKSNQKDDNGNRLVANPESNGRFHSDWLSMIYPRLKLARNLLRDDGVIFISIGDREIDNQIKLAKEVFGEENFVATILRQKKKKPSFLHSNIGSMFEYVVCAAKSRETTPPFSVDVTTQGKKYPINNAGNSLGVLKFPAQSVRFSQISARYEPQDMSEGNIATRLLDAVNVANGRNTNEFRLEGEFRYSQNRLNEIISAGDEITISKSPFRPNHIKAGGETKKMHNLLTPDTYAVGTNEDGSEEIDGLFDTKIFDNPKPSSLVKTLCHAVTYDDEQSVIVDFFAGTSSTAHAVMQLNAEDGGNRKFVMVQLPEECTPDSEAAKAGYSTIAEISKERIRRAGKKILEGEVTDGWDKDIGFRVLKVDSSNMADVHYIPDETQQTALSLGVSPIKADRSSEDLLFQVLLDWSVGLTLPITKEKVLGKWVYLVNGGEDLMACFDTQITEELIEALANRKPQPCVWFSATMRSCRMR